MKKILLLGVLCFSISQNLVLGQELTVVAYNVEFSRTTRPENVADLLAPVKPDIICFSEVPNGGWTGKVGKILDMPYHFIGSVASGNHILQYPDLTHKHFGKFKSILSKHPIVEGRDVITQGDGWRPAGAVRGTIVLPEGDSITVYSLHVPTGIESPSTSASFDLVKYLNLNHGDNDNIVLAGDFNDLNDSQSMRLYYENGFESTWDGLDIDLNGRTTSLYKLSPTPDIRVIDHIIYRGLEAIEADILEEKNTPLSDHKAVWAKLRLF